MGGPLAADIRLALEGLNIPVISVVAGLGGRAITKASLRTFFEEIPIVEEHGITFLDLNWEMIAKKTESLEAA